jgi:hypothetical protein
MAQSLANVLVHFVFSTKNRHPWIDEEIQPDLSAYIGGLFRHHDCRVLIIGGSPLRRSIVGCCHATGWHSTTYICGRKAANGRPYRALRRRGRETIGPACPRARCAHDLGCQRPALRASRWRHSFSRSQY